MEVGTGGGVTLWWGSINHLKVKGSKVPTTPRRGENVLLSAARGFSAAVQLPGFLAAVRRSHFPGTTSLARANGLG